MPEIPSSARVTRLCDWLLFRDPSASKSPNILIDPSFESGWAMLSRIARIRACHFGGCCPSDRLSDRPLRHQKGAAKPAVLYLIRVRVRVRVRVRESGNCRLQSVTVGYSRLQ